MTIRKRKQGVLVASTAPFGDYGPGVRRDKAGRLVEWGGAASTVLEYRDDPDAERHQLIRGARRRNVLADLAARRIITKRMHDAAESFLDDCSIASGGTAGGEIGGFSGGTANRAGLPERQVLAITRVNEVRHCLGLNDGTVFWYVVFENKPICDYETRHCLRHGTGTALLTSALDSLDQHYNKRGRPVFT